MIILINERFNGTILTKKFGDFIAVDTISFSIAEGEIFAFLGPNGAGKSTTILIRSRYSIG